MTRRPAAAAGFRRLGVPSTIAAVGLVACAGVAAAQSRASVHPVPPPTAAAALRTGDIHVDGRLDEPAWREATPISAFTQSDPIEGAPATQRTDVRVLYDSDAIYIGARMFDSRGAAGVRTRLARRDQLTQVNGNNNGGSAVTSDQLQVVFDTYHDHLGRAQFSINPSGVKDDALDVGGSGLDESWDPVWEGAARIDSLGWTAELRIPLSQLRYTSDSVQTWGMQVVRIIDRLNEHDQWAFWRKSESGGPSRYGHLMGLRLPRSTHELEALPYVVERSQRLTPVADDPFHVGRGTSTRFGADLKYLVTSNLTLDATINPDFGQVEVDPAVVNLTAYETFYPEKRPFFVANSGAFDFGDFSCYFCTDVSNLNVFYSRRIGRPPQLAGFATDQAQFADVPDNATILGAAKLTGRTAGGTSIGVLDAVTNRQNALLQSSPTGPRWQQEVEPLTNYFVGRVKQDLRQGASHVGGILTSVVRQMDDTAVSDRLRSRATAAGFDMSNAWHARDYRFNGQFVVSDVAGSPAAIANTMRSGTHYFQRPDRKVVRDGLFTTRYDTTATALRGYGAYARMAKENGNWLWETAVNARSPGFEVNDAAYLGRGDYVWQNANVVRQWTLPTRWFRNAAAGVGSQWQHNFDGDVTTVQQQVGAVAELPNYWNVQAFAVHHPSTIDDALTRGGPSVRNEGYDLYIGGFSTDSRRAAVLNVNANHVAGIDAATDMWNWSPSVTLKPTTNVSIAVGPSFYSIHGGVQYVTGQSDATDTAFFGTRYVFAELAQRMVSLDTRLNVTFSPTLTLELFAQPFDASGHYASFFEFARRRDRQRTVYGRDAGTITATYDSGGALSGYVIDPDGAGPAPTFTVDNPDFSVRSLRGNAVLRWEYRPGSTLFFVWTQQRFSSDATGELDFSRDRVALARAHPDNVFLVKATYWLGF